MLYYYYMVFQDSAVSVTVSQFTVISYSFLSVVTLYNYCMVLKRIRLFGATTAQYDWFFICL